MKPPLTSKTNSLPVPQSLIDLLQCPQSKENLKWDGSDFKNPAGLSYPLLGSIPWLLPYPASALDHWIGKQTELNAYFKQRVEKLQDQQKQKNLSAITRQRLNTLEKALLHNQKILGDCLTPLAQQNSNKQTEINDKIPAHQSLTLYMRNLFRDWCWQSNENQDSLNILQKILPQSWAPKKFLTLGCGSSRLPLDLHQKFNLSYSVAVDFNPLLILFAQQMLENKKIKLYELPLAPIELSQVAIENELKNPYSKIKNFHLLFADALHLPFKDKSFDSLLTPWFIDIVPIHFELLAQRVNRVLEPSGEWINFGPLGFMFSDEHQCFTFEEIQETLTAQGFRLEKYSIDLVPYLESPNSTQKRFEKVLSFRATKICDCEEKKFQYLPDWLLDHNMTVPLNSHVQELQLKAKVNADIIFSIDGKKSINDLANLMSSHYKMEVGLARSTIVTYLNKFYESRVRRY
ncbi:MAG: methyltransferase domain-containing protein [Bdellovibrionota bacterium]